MRLLTHVPSNTWITSSRQQSVFQISWVRTWSKIEPAICVTNFAKLSLRTDHVLPSVFLHSCFRQQVFFFLRWCPRFWSLVVYILTSNILLIWFPEALVLFVTLLVWSAPLFACFVHHMVCNQVLLVIYRSSWWFWDVANLSLLMDCVLSLWKFFCIILVAGKNVWFASFFSVQKQLHSSKQPES